MKLNERNQIVWILENYNAKELLNEIALFDPEAIFKAYMQLKDPVKEAKIIAEIGRLEEQINKGEK